MSDTCSCNTCTARRLANVRPRPRPVAPEYRESVEQRNAAAYAEYLKDDRPAITHAGQCRLVNNQTGEPLGNVS